MSKPITILLLMTIFFNSCKKETTVNTILTGDYYGIMTSTLYVSATGQTTIDTIDSNLKMSMVYNEADKILHLVCANALFDSISMNEMVIADSTSMHYGNDKVFEYTNNGPDWRYYYLHYNRVGGRDSIYIKTYQQPGSGWNRSEVYRGLK